MTNDELLAKLTPSLTYSPSITFGAIPILNSLCAVVELHKPFNYSHHFTDKVFIYCSTCKNHEYPCPTIQAIEKELQ